MGFIFLSLGNGEKKPPRSSSNDSFINFTFHFVVNLSQRNYFHLLAGVFPRNFPLPNPKSNATAFRNDTSRKHLFFFGSVAILSPNWTEALNSVFWRLGLGGRIDKQKLDFNLDRFSLLPSEFGPRTRKTGFQSNSFPKAINCLTFSNCLRARGVFPQLGKAVPTPTLSLESVLVVTSSKQPNNELSFGTEGRSSRARNRNENPNPLSIH